MPINLSNVRAVRLPADRDTMVLIRNCPFCGKEQSLNVNIKRFHECMGAYNRGALVQHAFPEPEFSNDHREFLMTGICPECWDNL